MFEFEVDETSFTLLRNAESHLERKEFSKAKEIAEGVLEYEPENRYALYILAEAGMMEGDFDLVKKVLKEWRELYLDDPYPFILSAEFCLMEADFQSALEEMDKALKIDPNNFDSLIFKAQLLDLNGDERAEELIERAKDLDEERTARVLDKYWLTGTLEDGDEDRLASLLYKVTSLMSSGKDEKAMGLISEMREMEVADEMEDVKEALDRMEYQALLNEGKIEELEEKITEKLEDKPEDLLSLYYSAHMYYLKGEMEEALETLEMCISVSEEREAGDEMIFSFEFYYLKAEVLRYMGDENWEDVHEKAEELHRKIKGELKKELGDVGLFLGSEGDIEDKENRKTSDRGETTLDEFL